jgi:hypothetical protein
VDGLAIQPLGERIEDPLAPPAEGEVVAQPTKQGLERVCVAVDASRDDRHLPPVFAFVIGKAVCEFGRRARVQDPAALDHQPMSSLPSVVGKDELGGDQGHGSCISAGRFEGGVR